MNQEFIEQVADRLDLAAARLIRENRRRDNGSDLSAARLGALSAVAASGPLSLAQLAAAQQVRAPTMSRIVDGLVRDALISREVNASDRRGISIRVTDKGVALLREGRKLRARALADRMQRLGESEQRALVRGVELLERLTRN
ncbi:MAG TPA: MarR family transcriptional regulator [Allosphingosinicella sp.]|nr:MarR family transcriptional regulator [Allosphingosinicella sp.]HJQ60316.1 MarR family transcriptional regulator [Vineibacter sp.]